MYMHEGKPFLDDKDQCNTCSNFVGDIKCPLVNAFIFGFIDFTGDSDDSIMTDCKMYSEFKRNLKVIKGD